MFVNGAEVEANDLLDDDSDTCVGLHGYDDCDMDKGKAKSCTLKI